ncbi:lysostaphin resistance A-like protein [Hymenobacter coalescens]
MVFFAVANLVGTSHRHTMLVTLLATDSAKALIIVFLMWYAGKSRVLPLRLLAPREQPGVYAAMLGIAGAQLILRSQVHHLGLPSWQLESVMQKLAAFPVAAGFTICVAAPVLEELLFRGVMLPGLERNYGSGKAILQSSLLFGLFHLNPAQAVSAFLLGLLAGWVYVRTRSLAACIWLHFLNNAVAFGAGFLPALRHYDSVSDMLPTGWSGAGVLGLTLGLLLLGMFAIGRLTRRPAGGGLR